MGVIRFALIYLMIQTGCSPAKTSTLGASPAVENSSVSGIVASLVGGALSNSNPNGTLALQFYRKNHSILESLFPNAYAFNACPTYASTGSSCWVTQNLMYLTYSNCSLNGASSSWTGTALLMMSAGAATCGTFPSPGASQSLVRQFVTSFVPVATPTPPVATPTPTPQYPGSAKAIFTSAQGTVFTIDDETANLANFDLESVTSLPPSYGTMIQFDGNNTRSSVTIKRRVYSIGNLDYSVNGTLTVSESQSGANSRTISGSIVIFDNLLNVKGTSTFSGVTHVDSCCVPVSGTIVTNFYAGTNVAPNAQGTLSVSKSETLTLLECGLASLTRTDGTTLNVSLDCL